MRITSMEEGGGILVTEAGGEQPLKAVNRSVEGAGMVGRLGTRPRLRARQNSVNIAGVLQVVDTATVQEGRLASVRVRLSTGVSAEGVRAMERFRSVPQEVGLPTAPRSPVVVRRRGDRPRPRLDRMEGAG